MRGWLVLASLLVAATGPPCSATAWTEASVRSARAEVDLLEPGRARVSLRARVRVDGGWLEGMDLEGLDDDAALDPERPVRFFAVNGTSVPVVARSRGRGRVSLEFRRRTAPRRGEYDLEVHWTTSLSRSARHEDGRAIVRWVFPAWRFGLDAVRVRWLVPEGAAPFVDAVRAPAVRTEMARDERGRLLVTFERAHLPRTSAWETSVLLPANAWPHSASIGTGGAERDAAAERRVEARSRDAEPSQVRASGEASSVSPRERTGAAALACIVAVAATVKRRDFATRARRTRRRVHPLLPAPPWAAGCIAACLAAFAVVSAFFEQDPTWLVAGVVVATALAWHRVDEATTPARTGTVIPVRSAALRAARRSLALEFVSPAAWLDPARGGLVASALVFAAAWPLGGPARALAALFLATILGSSRTQLGTDPQVALRSLAKVMNDLRVRLERPFVSVRLLARDVDGSVDPHLHVSFSEGVREPTRNERSLLDAVRMDLRFRGAGRLRLRCYTRLGSPLALDLGRWGLVRGYDVETTASHAVVKKDIPLRGASAELDAWVTELGARLPSLAPDDQGAAPTATKTLEAAE